MKTIRNLFIIRWEEGGSINKGRGRKLNCFIEEERQRWKCGSKNDVTYREHEQHTSPPTHFIEECRELLEIIALLRKKPKRNVEKKKLFLEAKIGEQGKSPNNHLISTTKTESAQNKYRQ